MNSLIMDRPAYYLLTALCCIAIWSCGVSRNTGAAAEPAPPAVPVEEPAAAPSIVSKSIDDLLTHYQQKGTDSIYCYNFWATWCGPCVREMLYFQALPQRIEDDRLSIKLVALELNSNPERLRIFAEQQDLFLPIWNINDWQSHQDWIKTISSDWTGAIPITVLVHPPTGRRQFHIDAFDDAVQLSDWVQDFIDRVGE